MFGFGRRLTLFRLFGIKIQLDLSWIILAALITWSLAEGVFKMHTALPAGTRWWMGAFGAIGLFASIIFHEMSHALVARRHGIPIKGITLFVFGGVAEMEEEPPNAKAEFLMAAVGPLASVVLGALFGVTWLFGQAMSWPQPITAVVAWLGFINVLLAVFNMLPAFPLDGGRVLRSILWGARGDVRWATRVASGIGVGFSAGFMVLGVFWIVTGNFIGGLWWLLIGLFLRTAARMPYRQLVVRQALEGEPLSRFMRQDPITVSRSIPVSEFVQDYLFRHHYKLFPVMDGDRLLGCVTLDHVKALPREEWDRHSVGEIADPCDDTNTIRPDEDAVKALAKMSRTGAGRLMVVDDGRLVGLIALRDLLAFLSLKVELEER